MSNPFPQRRWATLPMLARERGVTDRAARRWAKVGYLRLYKIPGVRGVCVDLDEANAALDALIASGKVKPDYGTFGGQPIHHVAEAVEK